MLAESQSLTSVVMVTYHSGPVLFEAIQSVLAQTAPVELVLVGNGDSPETVARLLAIAEKDKRLRYIRGHGNIGFSRGCNMGASATRGSHLLFLNPDNVLPRDAVAKLQHEGMHLKRPYMLGARLLNMDGTDQRGCRRSLLTPATAFIEALHLYSFFPKARLNHHEEPVPDRVTPTPAISGAFMFLSRGDFWNVGGFDEGYFLHVEDLDLCLRFRRAEGEIYFVPEVVVMHVGGTSRMPRISLERHKARGFVRYFHKNFAAQYPLPFLWLLDAAIWIRAEIRMFFAAQKSRQAQIVK